VNLKVFSDGGSKGNPGPSGYGVVIRDDAKNTLCTFGNFIGITGNNIAEYVGAIMALRKAAEFEAESVQLFSDSQLVVCQVNGLYRVHPKYAPYYRMLLELKEKLAATVDWIPRGANQLADKECDYAIRKRVTCDPRGIPNDPFSNPCIVSFAA